MKALKIKNKIYSSSKDIKNLKRPIVFTNGCFDILHAGHVDYLEQAASFGETLVVGVNSDASIKMQGKGDDRPINNLHNRQYVLAALASVDAVIFFDDFTPEKLIEEIVPDVLIKGGDWEIANIAGAAFVQKNGGKVMTIDFSFDTSTSKTIKKIRS